MKLSGAVAARCSSAAERSLMVRWVVGSIPHGAPKELFLVPTTACVIKAMVCTTLSVEYKRTLPANRIFCLTGWSFTIRPTPYSRKIKCVEYVVK